MTRLLTILGICLAIGLSLGLFQLKYEVQELVDKRDDLERSIGNDRQAIHVLQAEWSHLNNPERLRGLAVRHLGLEPLQPMQMTGWQGLPDRQVMEVAAKDAAKPVTKPKKKSIVKAKTKAKPAAKPKTRAVAVKVTESATWGAGIQAAIASAGGKQ
ncbi:hypothetical protein [Magnetospira sp. QH-2]|uniref:cell division protein FtsL n=1 Tax=Magnetospira sp. (strain QH-2) TaxID=1288970 RepID=UPI0003E80B93|nr:hypothetical protein [Magnetospira sp. QH-2]CCQ72811.1 Conserved protein of unknown function [Magnetospira sp. QH-2]